MSSRRRRSSRRGKRNHPGDDEPSSSTGSLPSSEATPIEEEGDDLLDDDVMRADYRAMPALDKYERVGIDTRQYERMDAGERAAAEAAIMERERARKRTRRGGAGLIADEDEEDDRAAEELRARMRHRREDAAMGDVGEEAEELAAAMALEKDTPLRKWATTEPGRRFIQNAFRVLLNATVDGKGHSVYERKIVDMCTANEHSLPVSWMDLAQHNQTFAVVLADAPKTTLQVMHEQAKIAVGQVFPDYGSTSEEEVHVRITDVPLTESLRDLRQAHLNTLIQVEGVVTRRSLVFPQLMVVRYLCHHCKYITPPLYTHDGRNEKLGSCPECQTPGPFTLAAEHSIYRNYQTITLQETPGSVPAGRVPRYKQVILTADLVDKVRPGDEVQVVGVYTNRFELSLNTRQGFPVFSTVIEANNVVRKEVATKSQDVTDEELEAIHKLAEDPQIVQRIVKSIAPSVFGQKHMKTAIAMSMFGGAERMGSDGVHRIRGDVNVLLLGDPGTAKSQCLKYVEKTASRAVFTTGKGASAVGLTAAVHKDRMTGEYTLEGGALVLADRGTCLIDEFDKMNDQDRTSIHEAMEQQSISISKAGIVTSLNARCAVVAAANPIGGRYDPSKSFSENVLLTDPILQRFDVLCVLQDTVNTVEDRRMARFVINSHAESHPDKEHSEDEERKSRVLAEEDGVKEIDQALLKKYIAQARKITPSVGAFNAKVAQFYADLRQASEHNTGVPVAVRHVESIMRLAQAHARMRLRNAVDDVDYDAAIQLMLDSFIQSQKYTAQRALRKQFASRFTTQAADSFPLLLNDLTMLISEFPQYARGIDLRLLKARARDLGITSINKAFWKYPAFLEAGFMYLPKENKVVFRSPEEMEV